MDRKPCAALDKEVVVKLIRALSGCGCLIILLFLNACQSPQPAGGSPVYDADTESKQLPSIPVAEQPSGRVESLPSAPEPKNTDSNLSAVSALEFEAWQYIKEKQWHKAIAAAEHGLRINRRYAPFYQILAEGYRSLENFHQAAQFARQALRFCGNNCADIEALIVTLGSY